MLGLLRLVALPADTDAGGVVLGVDEVGGEPAAGVYATAVGVAAGAGAGAAVGAPAGAGAAGTGMRVSGSNRMEIFFGMSTLSIPWIDTM